MAIHELQATGGRPGCPDAAAAPPPSGPWLPGWPQVPDRTAHRRRISPLAERTMTALACCPLPLWGHGCPRGRGWQARARPTCAPPRVDHGRRRTESMRIAKQNWAQSCTTDSASLPRAAAPLALRRPGAWRRRVRHRVERHVRPQARAHCLLLPWLLLHLRLRLPNGPDPGRGAGATAQGGGCRPARRRQRRHGAVAWPRRDGGAETNGGRGVAAAPPPRAAGHARTRVPAWRGGARRVHPAAS